MSFGSNVKLHCNLFTKNYIYIIFNEFHYSCKIVIYVTILTLEYAPTNKFDQNHSILFVNGVKVVTNN